ncbi:MAG: hypothetical protein KC445_10280 [Anaerolineales bacterium]|nr:hypothetical protein [Anaerolineales bacterium]
MFSKFFGNKGDLRVGPPLKELYNNLNDQQKINFMKQISKVPSGCDMVIHLGQTSEVAAKMIEGMARQWLKELSIKKQAVVGMEKISRGYVIYIKGQFENSQREQLKSLFLRYKATVDSSLLPSIEPMQMGIYSGCFEINQLIELTQL